MLDKLAEFFDRIGWIGITVIVVVLGIAGWFVGNRFDRWRKPTSEKHPWNK